MALFSDVKAYFLSGKLPAALGAAATGRNSVPVYYEARTYFIKTYDNSIINPTDIAVRDSSHDMAAAGGQPPTVSPPATTNADHSERQLKKTGLIADSGVIYQATG